MNKNPKITGGQFMAPIYVVTVSGERFWAGNNNMVAFAKYAKAKKLNQSATIILSRMGKEINSNSPVLEVD